MTIEEYTVSDNSGGWLYDHPKRTFFASPLTVSEWSKKPEIGDNITIYKKGNFNEIITGVCINKELVYEL